MGDVLLVMLPALILAAVLWAVATALKPRDFGLSDAERYQLELAARSHAHYVAQIEAATAARARVDAATRPSQNKQQQAEHARAALDALGSSVPGHRQPGHQNPVLSAGQLSPQVALQLQSLVRNGKKTQAIRMLRRATHSDHLTAKNYVDRL